jgi:hypothetical protein
MDNRPRGGSSAGRAGRGSSVDSSGRINSGGAFGRTGSAGSLGSARSSKVLPPSCPRPCRHRLALPVNVANALIVSFVASARVFRCQCTCLSMNVDQERAVSLPGGFCQGDPRKAPGVRQHRVRQLPARVPERGRPGAPPTPPPPNSTPPLPPFRRHVFPPPLPAPSLPAQHPDCPRRETSAPPGDGGAPAPRALTPRAARSSTRTRTLVR